MLTFPCPWCDHEVALTARAEAEGHVRCHECATVVDLASERVMARAEIAELPQAA